MGTMDKKRTARFKASKQEDLHGNDSDFFFFYTHHYKTWVHTFCFLSKNIYVIPKRKLQIPYIL